MSNTMEVKAERSQDLFEGLYVFRYLPFIFDPSYPNRIIGQYGRHRFSEAALSIGDLIGG